MRPLLLLLALLGTGMCYAQNMKSGGKLIPEQAIMDIRHYTIALTVDPDQKSINGYTEIDLVLSQETDKLVFDLTHLMNVSEVWVNGKKATNEHNDDRVYITGSSYPAGKTKVKIAYGGIPGIAERAPWIGGFQWEKDSLGNPWIAITCQMEGGKIFFPCKDHPSDEPNEGADMIITVPKGLTVAGPGLLKKVTHKGKNSTFHWKTNYTISNYCILFNVGKYKVVSKTYTTIDGNKVPMEFYALAYNADKGPHHLEILERSTKVLEKYFGEYPWVKEKIGIVETPHLGMEHQTMNAYGNKYRYSKLGGYDFDWLMHHEFGHEWWANKVTNRDWGHMWIQEGICTYGDALIIRELEGETAYQKHMAQTARQADNKLPVVQGDEVDSDKAYYGDIYGKGAFFMHSLRFLMGDSLFFPTLKKLATDPKYTYDNTVLTPDVEELFSTAYGKSLKPFFKLYLYTNDKIDFVVKPGRDNSYALTMKNMDLPLPVEVVTDKGVETITLQPNTPVKLVSNTVPQVDPKVFYFRRVIFE